MLIKEIAKKVKKSLSHLEFSYHKIKDLPFDLKDLNDEELLIWEGFTSRFSRTVDLFLTQYVRAKSLEADPDFRGTLIDIVYMGERLNILSDPDLWMEMRGIRNSIAHEYKDEETGMLYKRTRELTTVLLKVKNNIKEG